VIQLKADDVPARVMRADLRLSTGDPAGAIADLDTADRLAAQQADARFAMGHMYAAAERLPQAIAQYDQWIDAHPNDVRLASAYNSRCWARATSGSELARALADCNKANRLSANEPRFLEVRGLLRLRMGDDDRAITDFNASLKLAPNRPWCLYGRGEAERHKQRSGAAELDFAAAKALQPHVAEEFRKRGFGAPQ
jgi:tetratricopeptide (TPR) repeat protein